MDVSDDWALPDLAHLMPTPSQVGSERTGELTRYFDTERRDLHRLGVSLVRRTGGAEVGWELILPGESRRPTVRVPGDGRGVPGNLRTVLRGLAAGSALRPILTVRSERVVVRAYHGGRSPTLTVADERCSVGVTHTTSGGVSWREVTIVVRTADASLRRALRASLHDGAPRPPRHDARLAPLLGGPHVARSSPDGSLAAVLGAYLSIQVGVVLRGDLLIRSGDLRQIHSTRVAIRRFRSVLRVFAAILDPGSSVLDRELAWYAELLGAVRDLQVARRPLRAALDDLPDGLPSQSVEALLLATFDERSESARTALSRGLNSRRCIALLAQLRCFPEAGLDRAAELPAVRVRRFLQAQRRSARTRLRKARRRGGDTAAWHSARKAAKRTRYVAELAIPQLGKRARRAARHAKAVQDHLGPVQDAALVLDLLRTTAERAARAGDTTAVTLGALYAQQQAVQRAALRCAAANVRI